MRLPDPTKYRVLKLKEWKWAYRMRDGTLRITDEWAPCAPILPSGSELIGAVANTMRIRETLY